MVKKCLIDTSVVIQAQKGNPKIIQIMLAQTSPTVSIVTACEVICGSIDRQQLLANKEALERFKIIEIDEEISFKALEILEKYGLKVKLAVADTFIASTAVVKGYKLWTLNKKHFKIINEIELFEE